MWLWSFCGIVTLQVGTAVFSGICFIIAALAIGINVFDPAIVELDEWYVGIIVVILFAILIFVTGLFMFYAAWDESPKLCYVSMGCLSFTALFWIICTIIAFINKPNLVAKVCVRQRCGESFWLAGLDSHPKVNKSAMEAENTDKLRKNQTTDGKKAVGNKTDDGDSDGSRIKLKPPPIPAPVREGKCVVITTQKTTKIQPDRGGNSTMTMDASYYNFFEADYEYDVDSNEIINSGVSDDPQDINFHQENLNTPSKSDTNTNIANSKHNSITYKYEDDHQSTPMVDSSIYSILLQGKAHQVSTDPNTTIIVNNTSVEKKNSTEVMKSRLLSSFHPFDDDRDDIDLSEPKHLFERNPEPDETRKSVAFYAAIIYLFVNIGFFLYAFILVWSYATEIIELAEQSDSDDGYP